MVHIKGHKIRAGERHRGALLALSLSVLFLLLSCGITNGVEEPVAGGLSSSELTIKAWEMLSTAEYDKVPAYTDKCIELYGEEAARQQSRLSGFPDAI